MSSVFCSLSEAFTDMGDVQPPKQKKEKREKRDRQTVEGMAGAQTVDQIGVPPPPVPLPFRPPPLTGARLEASGGGDLFPLPGSTAEPEEWQKAFMLQPSQVPVPVNGQPTLWRQVAATAPQAAPVESLSPVPSNISERLDQLTRQLETLAGPTPIQGTAELFLFVGIGLLLLLAIDTLLRFATKMATSRKSYMMGGGARRFVSGRRWMIR